MSFEGAKVRLLPNTKRLKQVIKEHGEVFIVVNQEPKGCFLMEDGFLIKSFDGEHFRNVRATDLLLLATKEEVAI